MNSLKYIYFSGIVVSSVLLWGCGRGLPSKVDRIPESLNNPGLKVSGIYQDGWVSDNGALTLEQPGGKQVLTVRGTVPLVGNPGFRSDVELQLDAKPVGHWNIGLGDFSLSSDVPAGAGTRRVSIIFAKSQELPGNDGREVGAHLKFIGFESGSKAAAASDILRSMNLRLGSGWGALETFQNETFRWVANDSAFQLTGDQTGNAELSVTVEPGPGVGSKPFVLRVFDDSGRQVSAEPVTRRTTVKFLLPVEAGKPAEFRFHIDGGGKPTPKDPRILNFRVFEMEAAAWKGN